MMIYSSFNSTVADLMSLENLSHDNKGIEYLSNTWISDLPFSMPYHLFVTKCSSRWDL